ncbi:MAG: hypothetical protein HYZ53_15480 [Planctomycetes bacterium]|nr:hypothetical protein [Planctomycetota bacterium]
MALDLVAEMEGLVRGLASQRIEYALCGGLAVAVHGVARATKDIDILIRPEDEERALAAAEALGFTERALPMTFGAGTRQERRVRRISKLDGAKLLTVDFLVVTPVLEGVFRGRATYDWRGTPLTAVSRTGLIEMKRLAGRLQDLADIDRLERSDPDA